MLGFIRFNVIGCEFCFVLNLFVFICLTFDLLILFLCLLVVGYCVVLMFSGGWLVWCYLLRFTVALVVVLIWVWCLFVVLLIGLSGGALNSVVCILVLLRVLLCDLCYSVYCLCCGFWFGCLISLLVCCLFAIVCDFVVWVCLAWWRCIVWSFVSLLLVLFAVCLCDCFVGVCCLVLRCCFGLLCLTAVCLVEVVCWVIVWLFFVLAFACCVWCVLMWCCFDC